MPAIEAVRLLDAISPLWRENVMEIKVDQLDLQDGVEAWATSISDADYSQIRGDICFKGFTDKDKMVAVPKDRSKFVTLFLDKALGASVKADNTSKNTRSPTYGRRLVTFENLQQVITKYAPGALSEPQHDLAHYAFISE